ncbi:MAG: alpha/beta hydrolase [Anaerolineales bacterium]|nr:alpha/beta hydrolase [Anaerolineales bacterium]
MSSKSLADELPVSWTVDDIEICATLTLPAGHGPVPAVIFVAGSGPTDRNWNSPLLPGTNGSGGLLARELTERGFITLRYDKSASGPHAAENAQRMAGKVSMQSHVDELAGGVRLLASRKDVNPAQVFVLTNSEGCVHALNYQTQRDGLLFAGMVLTSAFARSAGDLARSQIAAQMAAIPGGDALLSAYDAAIEEFIAGRPVPANEGLPEGLQQLIMAITQPANQPFARELWTYNPATRLAEIKVPVLIVLGKKDIQVDWQTDGPLFETVARSHDNITIHYVENANHVLKFEPRPRAELTPAEVMATYSAEDVMLDPDTVATITDWLGTHVSLGKQLQRAE